MYDIIFENSTQTFLQKKKNIKDQNTHHHTGLPKMGRNTHHKQLPDQETCTSKLEYELLRRPEPAALG